MYVISPKLYDEVATRLREAIGRDSYFSGSVQFPFGEVECRFTGSLVVHHRTRQLPEGDFDCIADAVPVWWEFSTSRDGQEMLNDFSFGDLREFLL